jgi:hypothetical protein
MMQHGIFGGVAGVLLVIGVAALAALLTSSDDAGLPPFSVTESEVRAECLTATYVPEGAGWALAEKPPPRDWRQIEEAKQAMPAERGAVEVTLRPREGDATITLTGIHFDAYKHPLRPVGTVFYRPCRKQLVGPAIEFELDGAVEVASSNADPAGTLGVGLHLPRSAQPIRFPWTVSLSEPLRLYLVANTQHTYSEWSARIPWESDDSHGVIMVDNGGRKYPITDGLGTGWYKPGRNGQWIEGGSSTWIGVR